MTGLGLNWLGYKVERVDCIDPVRHTQGIVHSDQQLVQLLNTAADHVAVHENVHVWQHHKFPHGVYWKLAYKLPYIIRPHEICARLVQYGERVLNKSLEDFGWFFTNTKTRLIKLWQRQVERAATAAFEQAGEEKITEMIVRESGIKLTTASGRSILVLLCRRDSTEAYVVTNPESYAAALFERGPLFVRTTSRFKENVEGFIASIPRRL